MACVPVLIWALLTGKMPWADERVLFVNDPQAHRLQSPQRREKYQPRTGRRGVSRLKEEALPLFADDGRLTTPSWAPGPLASKAKGGKPGPISLPVPKTCSGPPFFAVTTHTRLTRAPPSLQKYSFFENYTFVKIFETRLPCRAILEKGCGPARRSFVAPRRLMRAVTHPNRCGPNRRPLGLLSL